LAALHGGVHPFDERRAACGASCGLAGDKLELNAPPLDDDTLALLGGIEEIGETLACYGGGEALHVYNVQ
jgi:hypothetical protein